MKSKRRDLAMIVSDCPASAAGVFTTNRVKAAPVKISRRHLKDGRAQAIVATSGNANACTGQEGDMAAERVARTLAGELGIKETDVLVSATGVIGEPYPIDTVVRGIEENVRHLSKRRVAGAMAANAIMTTDTFQKEDYTSFRLNGSRVNLAGIAKGSGMIHPNMATMMAFLACDADIEPELLQEALSEATARSFNMISVDGDTSTNDMVLILSNGLAGNRRITGKGPDYSRFRKHLDRLCVNLAKSIVSDGEGATKFIEYRVVNACSEEDARAVLRTVSNSNLVKTALFGRDPNWGRIIAAVGRSGAELDPDKVDLFIGSKRFIPVAREGKYVLFNKKQLKQMMKSARLKILIDLNGGDKEAVGWGSDFSYEYVRINAEYTT
jgi:glutamate N-acetyltransferase/amino-acid N-acetyltransferase